MKTKFLLLLLALMPFFFSCRSVALRPGINDTYLVDKEPELNYSDLVKNIVYPSDVKLKGIEGKTIVRALIDEDGNVEAAEIDSTSNNKDLDKEAINAVKKTKFTPAMNKGKTVPCWISVPINFKLR